MTAETDAMRLVPVNARDLDALRYVLNRADEASRIRTVMSTFTLPERETTAERLERLYATLKAAAPAVQPAAGREEIAEDESFWLDPPKNDIERMMLTLAKAWDAYHADEPSKGGAEIAVRAGNGIACPFWEYMAKAALAPAQQGEAWPEAWSGPCTVGNMIANLRTLPPEMSLYTAYHIPMDDKPSLLKVKRPTISRERVDGTNIKTGDESIPYSAVIWTQPRDPAEAHPPAQASESGGEAMSALDAALIYIEKLGENIERNDVDMHLDTVERPFSFAQTMRSRFAALSAPQAAPASGHDDHEDDEGRCDICGQAIKGSDLCATDVDLGPCHAACLEGAPDPDGKVFTYRWNDLPQPKAAPGEGEGES